MKTGFFLALRKEVKYDIFVTFALQSHKEVS